MALIDFFWGATILVVGILIEINRIQLRQFYPPQISEINYISYIFMAVGIRGNRYFRWFHLIVCLGISFYITEIEVGLFVRQRYLNVHLIPDPRICATDTFVLLGPQLTSSKFDHWLIWWLQFSLNKSAVNESLTKIYRNYHNYFCCLVFVSIWILFQLSVQEIPSNTNIITKRSIKQNKSKKKTRSKSYTCARTTWEGGAPWWFYNYSQRG